MAKAALKVVAPEADEPNDRELLEAKVRTYAKQLADAQATAKSAREGVNAIAKRAKADGLEVGVLKKILSMLEWTPAEIRTFFNNLRTYAQSLGLPTNTQGDLFEDVYDPRVPEAAREELEWGIRGYKDGLMGRGHPEEPPAECPPGAARQEYGRRWEEGQNDLAASLKLTQAPAAE